MFKLKNRSVIFKLWYFLRTYILKIKVFDLFLQGALLIVILLESNVYLLLRRDANEGYNSPLIEDFVLVAAGVVEAVLGAILAWWGGGKRHFALSGWLAVTSAAGLLVLAFPYSYSNPARVELCGGQPLSAYSEPAVRNSVDDNATPRTAALILTAILCALTEISIFAHGFTYLDDHEPQSGAYFYGILISIRLSLGLSGTNWLRASSVRDDWWEPHLSISMLTLMFAILFTLFPKKMSQWQEEELLVDTEFVPSLGRVTRNKAVMLQSGALACLTISVLCYVHYDSAYVQARFFVEAIRQDPRTSRTLTDVFRSLVVIFFIMIFRVRFSSRRLDGVKANTASRVGGVVAVLVAAFFVVLASLSCDTGEMVGLQGREYQQPNCSLHCGCNSQRYGYSPVCGLDTMTTFFSPCNAGCTEVEDLNGFVVYHNCTCGMQRAVRGSCTLQSCRLPFSAYQVFYAVILAVSGASFVMQGMVIVRAVRRIDKAIAVGFSSAVIGLFAYVLGRLLYMLISYLTCWYSNEGQCLFHRPLLWTMCATSSVFALLSAGLSMLASRVPPEPTTDL